MLPVLLNTPSTADQWNVFTLHHRTSHDLIRQAIQARDGSQLPDYVIDPIPPFAPKQWLEANQQLHTQMNAALGLPGTDIQDVNFEDQRQTQAWVWLHYLEHQTAETTLGISS